LSDFVKVTCGFGIEVGNFGIGDDGGNFARWWGIVMRCKSSTDIGQQLLRELLVFQY